MDSERYLATHPSSNENFKPVDAVIGQAMMRAIKRDAKLWSLPDYFLSGLENPTVGLGHTAAASFDQLHT
jgi:hypothetical protein